MAKAKGRLISSIVYLFLALLSTPTLAAYIGEGYNPAPFQARLPQRIIPDGQKVVIVNPRVHAWGAYDANGYLVRGGVATAGANWCPDLGRPCHTRIGTFYVNSLGSSACRSSKFPIPRGGAPMPYCMYFNRGQALHGSYEVVDGNASHGCVRLKVQDAEWLRFNFVSIGTKVVVLPY